MTLSARCKQQSRRFTQEDCTWCEWIWQLWGDISFYHVSQLKQCLRDTGGAMFHDYMVLTDVF